MQSHGGQVRQLADIPRWGDDVTDFTSPARFARRSLLKAAVLGRSDESDFPPITDSGAGPAESSLVYTVTGRILDVSPHILVLQTARGKQRFPLAASAEAWRGGSISPAALRQGDHAIIRRSLPGGPVVDRIWAEVGRATGTIIERDGPTRLLVDEGPAKGRRIVMIAPEATRRIQVRFPRLEPGYLVDVIGLRHGGVIEGLVPATSQPAYSADQVPRAPQTLGRALGRIAGSATWHEPAGEPDDVEGVAYPLLDPETGCAEEPSRGLGCVRMPYLSVGSLLEVRNECTGGSRVLPVTGCAAVARLFCDRCVTCGTSPRGRVADLALATFVALGGELERGCFN